MASRKKGQAPEIKVAKWSSYCFFCEGDIKQGQEILVYAFGRTRHSRCKAPTFGVHYGTDFDKGLIESAKHKETAKSMMLRFAKQKLGHEFSVWNEVTRRMVFSCVVGNHEIIITSDVCIYNHRNWRTS